MIPQKPWTEPEKEKTKKEEPQQESGKESHAAAAVLKEAQAQEAKGQESPANPAIDSGISEALTAQTESGDAASPVSAGASPADLGGPGERGAGLQTGAPVQSVPAETAAAEKEAVRTLRLSQIDPNRSQPRQNFEDEALEELSDSIRQFGVLQPILVQKKGNRYEIIAGERRWRASRKAGLTEIPAIVREYTDQETLELSLIENIQREDLNPIEEAKAFRRLLEEFNLRQEDLAARVSKSRTAITNSVRLLKLDERVQDMIVQGQLSMGHARALIPVEIAEEQYLIAQQVAEKHLSVRDVEKLIKTRLSGKKKKKDSGKGKSGQRDPALELAYREIEERLKQSLGTKTTIRHSGDGAGKLEIEFYSHEDLEKIVDMLT